ncbi:hypothetical protein EG346_24670 [Chryseobacterium carnipullorum]|uniref:Uncharacterized protein n=4 Tax=Chryseobacterium group TaxID=2782232 RepID=A0A085BIQ4_9FLAO|nr:hypothetical protein EG346_24670 [Chryseobacterium carnipullorum]AZB08324.1 hypothetical protein EG344_05355 [Chryseobacterium sp. G0162]KFC22349.1 hypothetical protein IO89_10465 [Epilithonimonas lactis]KFF27008.1 hypothetical protein IW16_07010 [Chryseobacterium vrystaatense]REC66206.1 hypothetical protein DRF58_16980 [Epilithonimonas hispanica]
MTSIILFIQFAGKATAEFTIHSVKLKKGREPDIPSKLFCSEKRRTLDFGIAFCKKAKWL